MAVRVIGTGLTGALECVYDGPGLDEPVAVVTWTTRGTQNVPVSLIEVIDEGDPEMEAIEWQMIAEAVAKR